MVPARPPRSVAARQLEPSHASAAHITPTMLDLALDSFLMMTWATDAQLVVSCVRYNEALRPHYDPRSLIGQPIEHAALTIQQTTFSNIKDGLLCDGIRPYIRALAGETSAAATRINGHVMHSQIVPLRNEQGSIVGTAGALMKLAPVCSTPAIPHPSEAATRANSSLERFQLTPRQMDVLRLIASGHSTKEIGRLLHLSPKTIEMHRALLMERLGIFDIAGLVRFAIRTGLVSADN